MLRNFLIKKLPAFMPKATSRHTVPFIVLQQHLNCHKKTANFLKRVYGLF